jgi:uncharacterized protein YecE (DUF72 family)
MEIRVGTSGYSYKEWRGAFYPEKLPEKQMLAFYAERFPTVEINNTFYRMPKPEVLTQWAEEVPPGFVFVLKASQRLTHVKRLKEPQESLQYLFEVARHLGDKLGPIYFQTHPNMKVEPERLEAFLAALPPDAPVSFELRHPSWHTDEVRALLAARNVPLVVVDQVPEPPKVKAGEPPPPPPRVMAPIVATADWGYLKLRRCDYTPEELDDWAARIKAQPWTRAYVFFKHEDDATGPLLGQQLMARLAG